MLAHTLYLVAVTAGLIWFSLGAHYFGFKHHAAAKILIPKSARDSPIFPTTAAATRFLGGMNAAWALLTLALLATALSGSALFSEPGERSLLLLVIASAHFSQFLGNVPILLNGERQGETYWPVLSGPMRMIFTVDALQTVLCVAAALAQ